MTALRLPGWQRALGLVPLLAMVGVAVRYARAGILPDLLWVCNVSNVVLGIGLLCAWPRWIWLATLLLIPGGPLWVWDLLTGGVLQLHSVVTHLGSAALGLWAMARLPKPGPRGVRLSITPLCLLTIAGLQLLCRLVTPPAFNVNVSHAVYRELAPYCPSYPLYWSANLLAFAVGLSVLEHLLSRWLPVRAP